MTDNVDHPGYYGGEDNPYEVIKVAEAWKFDQDAYLFNALKYIARPTKGNHLEDLKKAVWYLNRKIGRLEILADPDTVAAIAEAEAEIAGDWPLTTLDTVTEWSSGHSGNRTRDKGSDDADAQLTVKSGFQVWTEYATGDETVGEFADLAARWLGRDRDFRFRGYTLKFADMDPLPRNAKLKDIANPGDVLFLEEA